MQVITFHFDRQNAAIANDPIIRSGVLYADDEATQPINVTGWECVFVLLDPDASELLRLTTDNGGATVGTTDGAWALDSAGVGSPAVTLPATAGVYTYALEFANSSGVRQVAVRGNYVVLEDRTP